jgi:large subunit ribosomal protein L18
MSNSSKLQARIRRKRHIRKRIFGTEERPRLSVFRSAKHIYAQIVDDTKGTTLVSVSSLGKEFSLKNGGNVEAAKVVGEMLAEKALAAGINNVVVDRNGYLFHGRVKALAFAAKNKGLQF